MGLDINLNTSKIDISEEDGLNVDLYNDNIDISDDEADDIIIEITGLKSINKFIGLEDTPLYYDNGKFFKVEDNKIVYADIQWKDISGDISESPEIVAVISDLINEVASDIIDERINLHNLNTEAHPFIQNIIQENYNTLDTKIDNTKEELSQDISNLNNALNQEIHDRETSDNALSEDIQEEILARIEGDTTLQNNINTLNNNLQNEIDARIEGDANLSSSLDELSNNLIQEVLNRQEQDDILQQQITSNYNTLDGKIDTEISDRTASDTTLQNNINTEALARQNADTILQNNIDTLSNTVSDNYTDLDGKISDLTDTVNDNDTAINNKVDGINTTLTNNINSLSNTVSSNYTTLDTKIDNTKTSLEGDIDNLSTTVSNNYTTLDGKITNLTSTVNDNYTELDGRITTNTNNISTINSKIPTQATSTNQLADKDFVNSSIATNTANFIGTFNSVAELEAYSGTITNNDYAFVINTVITDNGNDWSSFASLDARSKTDLTNFDYAWVINGIKFDIYRFDIVNQEWLLRASNINKEDVSLNDVYNRYKASVSGSTVTWDFEYTLNNSSFTAEQWSAINSGATSTNIGQITINANNIADLQTNKQDVLTAGANIQINNNVISATDTTYTAGTGISIVNGVISNTQTSAEWGNIQGTLSDQTDLQNALNDKYDASNPDGYITSADLSNYVTNSSLATTLEDYQPLLISGTNIKTINNNSILGSGNLTLDGLPSQTGQSGKFLTTDGTNASWANTTKVTIRDWSIS